MSVQQTKTLTNTTALALFMVGLAIGFALLGVAAWGDFEGLSFDSTLNGDEPLPGLACPLVVTQADTASVKLTLNNPLERNIKMPVRAIISQGSFILAREEHAIVEIPKDSSDVVEWDVAWEDAAYDRFVLVKAYQHPIGLDIPSRDASCGIMTLDIDNMTGDQVVMTSMLVSVLGMGSGIGLWTRNNQVPAHKKFMNTTAGIMVSSAALVLAGIAANLMGFWFLSLIGFVGTLMMLMSVLSSTIRDAR